MNGFVTDVSYFRLNRKILKYSACLIFVLVLPSVVYSLPDNEIELPKDVNNEFENGLIQNIVGLDESVQKNFSINDGWKEQHRRKGGKRHKKFNHLRKSHKLKNLKDSNKNETSGFTKTIKYLDPKFNKFDYYPIEDVKVEYDPKEDDNIEFVLLSDNDSGIKEAKKKGRKRSKRDIQENINASNSKQKRCIHLPLFPISVRAFVPQSQSSQYYSHNTPNDPWNNALNHQIFIRYPIKGIYHNAVTPTRPPAVIQRGGGLDEYYNEQRPVWNSRPVNQGNSNRPVESSRRPSGSSNRPAGNSNRPTGNNNRPIPNDDRAPTEVSTPPPLIHRRPTNSNSNTNRPQVQTTRRTPSMSSSPNRPISPPVSPSNNNQGGTGIDNTIPTGREEGLSRCVWAIINCCSQNNLQIRYNCFEQIGCQGAFWDYNPCGDTWQKRALEEAGKYYESE